MTDPAVLPLLLLLLLVLLLLLLRRRLLRLLQAPDCPAAAAHLGAEFDDCLCLVLAGREQVHVDMVRAHPAAMPIPTRGGAEYSAVRHHASAVHYLWERELKAPSQPQMAEPGYS